MKYANKEAHLESGKCDEEECDEEEIVVSERQEQGSDEDGDWGESKESDEDDDDNDEGHDVYHSEEMNDVMVWSQV